MLINLEVVQLKDLPLDLDGDLLVIIDPRDGKMKQLYINQKEIWLKGFRAAEDIEESIDVHNDCLLKSLGKVHENTERAEES